MPAQPTPVVCDEDVERVLHRDFAAAEVATARRALENYGRRRWHAEPVRVRLAALKLADGDLEALRAQVRAADADYSDVLAAAEYPGWLRAGLHGPAEAEHEAVVEADAAQYPRWLKG